MTMAEIEAELGATPLYRRIVRTLQSEIVLGKYPVGTQLPSESTLTRRFGVSRHTVRAVRCKRCSRLGWSSRTKAAPRWSSGPEKTSAMSTRSIRSATCFRSAPRPATIPSMERWLGYRCGRTALRILRDGTRWLRITGDRRKPGADKPFNELEIYVASRFAGVGRMVGPTSGSIYAMLEAIYGETIGEVEHGARRIAELERKIGQLTMENDFLKKTLRHFRDFHPPAVVSGAAACLKKSSKQQGKVRR